MKRLRWWLEIVLAKLANDKPQEKYRCAWRGHEWLPSMELAYLHYECKHCYEHGETIMDTDEMVAKGLLECSSTPMPDDIQDAKGFE